MLAQLTKRKKVAVMISVMLGLLLAVLDQTIVSTAMPHIVQELNGLQHLSWVFTSYMLASTISVPIYGKLSDMYGRKKYFIAAIVIFLIGSVLSGAAHSMTQLIVFRAIQGIGGGALMANAFAIIGDLFPPAERGRWQGLFGAVFGLASVVGPLLGGWITDNASWRWIFYVNLPVGLIALIAVSILMPHIAGRAKGRIDYLGGTLLAGGLSSFLLAVTWGGSQYAWGSSRIIGLLVAALVFTVAFVLVERKAEEPILPPRLFKNRTFVVSMASIFFTAMALFGAIVYIPLFAQDIIGVSATNSGTLLTPMMFGLIASSIVAGQVMSRTGKYKVMSLAGISIAAIGMYLMSHITLATTQGHLLILMVVLGLGLGITMPIFNLVVQNAFPQRDLGVATASTQLFRNIGGTLGTALMASVLNHSLTQRLSSLQNDSFVSAAAQSGHPIGAIDGTKIQGLLSPQGRQALEASANGLPQPVAQQVLGSVHIFIDKVKDAFAGSIAEVFAVGAVLMLAALVVALWLPELPLRKTHDEPIEEAGKELAIEEGTAPANAEPSASFASKS
jgi:EmrB/QacA subfamily drug resistance transporter